MEKYYVHTELDIHGDHEVHTQDCHKLPNVHNREYLGLFGSCQPAVNVARQKGYHANGCIHCCPACHTT